MLVNYRTNVMKALNEICTKSLNKDWDLDWGTEGTATHTTTHKHTGWL